jgi:hypothetical protein
MFANLSEECTVSLFRVGKGNFERGNGTSGFVRFSGSGIAEGLLVSKQPICTLWRRDYLLPVPGVKP